MAPFNSAPYSATWAADAVKSIVDSGVKAAMRSLNYPKDDFLCYVLQRKVVISENLSTDTDKSVIKSAN